MKRKNNWFNGALMGLLTVALSSGQVRGADFNQVEQVIDNSIVPLITYLVGGYGLHYWFVEVMQWASQSQSQGAAAPDYFTELHNIGSTDIRLLYGENLAGMQDVNLFKGIGYETLKLASQGDMKLWNILFKAGVDVNAVTIDGRTVLTEAVRSRDIAIIKLLLTKGVDVNIVDRMGWTGLIGAVVAADGAIVELLLSAGADVNIVDKEGMTALLRAVSMGRNRILRLLLDRWADVNIADRNGLTALDWAVTNGDVATVQMLLGAGAPVNAAVLEHATQIGNGAIVQLLKNAQAQGSWYQFWR